MITNGLVLVSRTPPAWVEFATVRPRLAPRRSRALREEGGGIRALAHRGLPRPRRAGAPDERPRRRRAPAFPAGPRAASRPRPESRRGQRRSLRQEASRAREAQPGPAHRPASAPRAHRGALAGAARLFSRRTLPTPISRASTSSCPKRKRGTRRCFASSRRCTTKASRSRHGLSVLSRAEAEIVANLPLLPRIH